MRRAVLLLAVATTDALLYGLKRLVRRKPQRPRPASAPAFGAMSTKWSGAEFVKCDVDECREVAQREGVTAMPTFKIYKDAKCAWTCTGFRTTEIEKKLQELGATIATSTNKAD